MSRKGFRRVSREQSHLATIRSLRGLRDTAVRLRRTRSPKTIGERHSPASGRGGGTRTQADAMERGEGSW
jgi:hypothetical protein